MSSISSVAKHDLPRSSIAWFLVAYCITVFPQFFLYLPLWIIPIFIFCFAWRVRIYQAKASYPRVWIKIVLIVFLLLGMYLSYGNFLTTLGCSILLIALYSLKFIEAKTIRDGWILVLLGYFAIAITYLYSNDLFIALYSLVSLTAVTCGALGLQQTNYEQFSNRSMILHVVKMLMMSVPLMVVLFIAFPRLPSFMSFAKQTDVEESRTGISDSMTPGDISQLIQDNSHAFWADFSDYVPRASDLYWRVLTLDTFDGRSWRQNPLNKDWSQRPAYKTNNTNSQIYNVFFDPTNRNFIATLDISVLTDFYNDDFIFYPDFRVEHKRAITTKIRYEMRHFPYIVLEPNLSFSAKRMEVMRALPKLGNPRIREWVNERKDSARDPEMFVQMVFNHFRQNGFSYTLEPPKLGANSIDEFFFDTRRGFCEHYASSLTFILREAGIPSRIVLGYLGGEVNQDKKRVQVRGMDAHSWVEYWVANRGWVRADPTSTVAPNRIELGMAELLNDDERQKILGEGTFSFISVNFTQLKELLEYQWTKLILGYQGDVQRGLFNKLFGFVSWRTLLTLTISLLAIGFFISALIFIKPWRQLQFSLTKMYEECQQLLISKRGVSIAIGVAPQELYQKSKGALSPIEEQLLHELVVLLERYLFKPDTEGRQDVLKEIKLTYKKLRRMLLRKRYE